MKIHYAARFVRSYFKAPEEVQETFNKQALLLLHDLRHPSLHAKKYDESADLWQARVNYDWPFYFRIGNDIYLMDDIKHHPK